MKWISTKTRQLRSPPRPGSFYSYPPPPVPQFNSTQYPPPSGPQEEQVVEEEEEEDWRAQALDMFFTDENLAGTSTTAMQQQQTVSQSITQLSPTSQQSQAGTSVTKMQLEQTGGMMNPPVSGSLTELTLVSQQGQAGTSSATMQQELPGWWMMDHPELPPIPLPSSSEIGTTAQAQIMDLSPEPEIDAMIKASENRIWVMKLFIKELCRAGKLPEGFCYDTINPKIVLHRVDKGLYEPPEVRLPPETECIYLLEGTVEGLQDDIDAANKSNGEAQAASSSNGEAQAANSSTGEAQAANSSNGEAQAASSSTGDTNGDAPTQIYYIRRVKEIAAGPKPQEPVAETLNSQAQTVQHTCPTVEPAATRPKSNAHMGRCVIPTTGRVQRKKKCRTAPTAARKVELKAANHNFWYAVQELGEPSEKDHQPDSDIDFDSDDEEKWARWAAKLEHECVTKAKWITQMPAETWQKLEDLLESTDDESDTEIIQSGARRSPSVSPGRLVIDESSPSGSTSSASKVKQCPAPSPLVVDSPQPSPKPTTTTHKSFEELMEECVRVMSQWKPNNTRTTPEPPLGAPLRVPGTEVEERQWRIEQLEASIRWDKNGRQHPPLKIPNTHLSSLFCNQTEWGDKGSRIDDLYIELILLENRSDMEKQRKKTWRKTEGKCVGKIERSRMKARHTNKIFICDRKQRRGSKKTGRWEQPPIIQQVLIDDETPPPSPAVN